MDAHTYFLNQKLNEEDKYLSWIESNEDFILEQYTEQLDVFPQDIYEGVLDDDYEDAETSYCEGLTFEDVPDWFVQQKYEASNEGM
jgi:hypothetical protein